MRCIGGVRLKRRTWLNFIKRAWLGQNRTCGLTWVVANPRNGRRFSRLFAINEAERRVLATSWKGAPQSIEHGVETAPVTLC